MLFRSENLGCRRNLRLVFRDVNFSLGSGEALVVTGANGSGKSSLLRVLAGLLPRDSGTIKWGEFAVDWAEHRRRLHYLGHKDALKNELTVLENLKYWGALRRGHVAHALPEALGLQRLFTKQVATLSAGQRRKLTLARLIMSDAPLWLLDEPTTALDAEGQTVVVDFIESHRAKGGVAVIASHQTIPLKGAKSLSLGSAA